MLDIPKNPANAFSIFLGDQLKSRSTHAPRPSLYLYKHEFVCVDPDVKIQQAFSEGAQQWKSMDASARTPYERRAKEEREKSLAAKGHFLSSLHPKRTVLLSLLSKNNRIESGRATRRILTEDEKALLQRLPQYAPQSGYVLFIKEKRGSAASTKSLAESQALMKQHAAQWKALSHEERQHYTRLAKEAQARYQRELQSFVSSCS